jgi:galactose-1-phosphate uridylyltransferase
MITHTQDPLIFNAGVNKIKYSKNGSTNENCPFCDKTQQANVRRVQDDMVWLDNKFMTIENSLMTVLIESADHLGDVTTYSQEKNRELFRFVMACWQETIDSGKFDSVLMFKNFGPMSGGSLRHPHMQIVGLTRNDGYEDVTAENFTGLEVLKNDQLEITLSEHPIMGLAEANIMQKRGMNAEAENAFADAVQNAAKYYMNDFMGGRCESYNLFFYQIDGRTICKIVPRFLTSPYFIGYKIPQVFTDERMQEIVQELRKALKC